MPRPQARFLSPEVECLLEGKVGGGRRSLAWVSLVPASLPRKPGAELPAKGTQNGRRLEDNTETRKKENKQRYQRRDKNNKSIITVLLS